MPQCNCDKIIEEAATGQITQTCDCFWQLLDLPAVGL